MKIYVAGPMRGLPEFNFPAFHAATKLLRNMGHDVFNPAERDEATGFSSKGLLGTVEEMQMHNFSIRDALACDTQWICLHAEAIVLLPGWENSFGARAERALAEALDLPVMEFHSVTVK